jgi:glycosyltransferase involved in cell wall biosynthesis
MRALRERGHSVSFWLEDSERRHAQESHALIKHSFRHFFAADDLPFEADLSKWHGADVVLATGWQTVPRALLLGDVAARAYLVQDHEPEFYGTSAEALWARDSYRRGLHCIAASEWLAELLRTRYGASAAHFDLPVDHATYRPRGKRATHELVVFYARAATPRRAVPLGLLALEELARRRPGVEIALFGEAGELEAGFQHTTLGVLDQARLAELYSRATVGLVLSLTNPSLVGLQMMACGLPCVELASEPMLATFGESGPLALAAAEPPAICEQIERLLDDPGLREARSQAGVAAMAMRTSERAAEQLERGLQHVLAQRTASR